ncbi:uncharacterized protein LOC125074034 [Vanessa atalanta]|uniref:uncharacterized protein LOC125074034 n=1 Tax=Vanessa atalanta TaxID=42275 RepID=UPI001FCCEE20|nr:uncharacterized protein LOC125074034 [Vanessa atalanta]
MLQYIIFILIIYQYVTANDVHDTNEKIQELEKEKNDLFKRINEAIEESIKSLQKSNETDALLGLKYMSDLKEHLKEANETIVDVNENRINVSDVNSRRKLRHRMKKNDPFDFETILKPKKMKVKEWKEIVLDRTKMQNQLNEWILKRQKEKERLQEQKLYKKGLISSGKFEKCPRFGYQGMKKKVGKDKEKIKHCKEIITGSDLDEAYKKCISLTKTPVTTTDIYDNIKLSDYMKNAKKNKYPCCRKCCKKSYMGCL